MAVIELEVKDDWLDRLVMDEIGKALYGCEMARDTFDSVEDEDDWIAWNDKVITMRNAIRILKGEW
jgi:hypothetical protein